MMANLADALAGENRNITINTETYETAEQALTRARELAAQAELMLIKGSNGSGAHQIAADLRRLAGKGGGADVT